MCGKIGKSSRLADEEEVVALRDKRMVTSRDLLDLLVLRWGRTGGWWEVQVREWEVLKEGTGGDRRMVGGRKEVLCLAWVLILFLFFFFPRCDVVTVGDGGDGSSGGGGGCGGFATFYNITISYSSVKWTNWQQPTYCKVIDIGNGCGVIQWWPHKRLKQMITMTAFYFSFFAAKSFRISILNTGNSSSTNNSSSSSRNSTYCFVFFLTASGDVLKAFNRIRLSFYIAWKSWIWSNLSAKILGWTKVEMSNQHSFPTIPCNSL